MFKKNNVKKKKNIPLISTRKEEVVFTEAF